MRNISTSVELTNLCKGNQRYRQKHLHERGAYRLTLRKSEIPTETSPRAWSLLSKRQERSYLIRNISTSVELTALYRLMLLAKQKHLHERGAYHNGHDTNDISKETSPRAWSLLIFGSVNVANDGNISTSVELTIVRKRTTQKLRKHLHERGAYNKTLKILRLMRETSPRAWSLLVREMLLGISRRNISTSVELTELSNILELKIRNISTSVELTPWGFWTFWWR